MLITNRFKATTFLTLDPKYGVFSLLTGMDLSAPEVFLTKVDMT